VEFCCLNTQNPKILRYGKMKVYNLYNILFIIAAALVIIYSILEGRIKIMHVLFLLLISIIAMLTANLQLKDKDKKINNLLDLLGQNNEEMDRLKGELGKSKKSLKELKDKIKKI